MRTLTVTLMLLLPFMGTARGCDDANAPVGYAIGIVGSWRVEAGNTVYEVSVLDANPVLPESVEFWTPGTPSVFRLVTMSGWSASTVGLARGEAVLLTYYDNDGKLTIAEHGVVMLEGLRFSTNEEQSEAAEELNSYLLARKTGEWDETLMVYSPGDTYSILAVTGGGKIDTSRTWLQLWSGTLLGASTPRMKLGAWKQEFAERQKKRR